MTSRPFLLWEVVGEGVPVVAEAVLVVVVGVPVAAVVEALLVAEAVLVVVVGVLVAVAVAVDHPLCIVQYSTRALQMIA
jgi:hypothetical protein